MVEHSIILAALFEYQRHFNVRYVRYAETASLPPTHGAWGTISERLFNQEAYFGLFEDDGSEIRNY